MMNYGLVALCNRMQRDTDIVYASHPPDEHPRRRDVSRGNSRPTRNEHEAALKKQLLLVAQD